ncbi:MAG: hypothetical protein CSA96_05540 [Bacteroidetes bacterium]|nr:MAG: hypothetical protein CSA96_05540 [Bacteroidota bacterium]
MKRNIFFQGIGFMLLLVLVGACKKEEDEPEFKPMSFDSEEVLAKLPSGLKSASDSYAEDCVEFIETAVDMSSFIDNMLPPEDAKLSVKNGSSQTWTWTWSYLGQSFSFIWTYEEDKSRRYWSMDIQFNDGPAKDYLNAWESLDGSEGEVVYNFNWVLIGDDDLTDYEDLYWKYSWKQEKDGTYRYTWQYDSSDPDYTYYLQHNFVINPDGSGSIDYYSLDELSYHMEWEADGSGTWSYHLGGIHLSGSWTAG